MRRTIFAAVTALCTLFAAEAMADESVAVMKLDVSGTAAQANSEMVLDALRTEVTNGSYVLDANGADITYSEMQMLTGCDRDANIACYEAACESLGSSQIIFGDMTETGETKLVWYVSGKGIFREVTGTVTDKASADKIAQRMIVGEKGSLIVTSNIPGADVFIDGKRVGMAAEYEQNAQPIELLAGNYIVSVRKEGYEKEDAQKVTIVGGEQSKLNIDLVVAIDTGKMQRTLKIAGWSTLGVGAAGLVAGGVLGLLTNMKNEEMNDDILKKQKVDASINDTGETMAMTTNILLGVGGVAAVAGVALVCVGYLYNFESDEALANTAIPKVDFTLTSDYQGMNLGWTF